MLGVISDTKENKAIDSALTVGGKGVGGDMYVLSEEVTFD